jgi:hypothetical protein
MPDRALGRNLAQVNRAHAGLEKITVAATFAAKPLIVGADSVRLADRASFIAGSIQRLSPRVLSALRLSDYACPFRHHSASIALLRLRKWLAFRTAHCLRTSVASGSYSHKKLLPEH